MERVRGFWRGTIDLPPHGSLILLVAGSRKGPTPSVIDAAQELPSNYDQCRASLAEALFDHYLPYIDIRDAVTEIEGPFPDIDSAEEVWPHVHPLYVLVRRGNERPVTEIALSVEWDPEHTLGARLVGADFSELCSSVRRLISWAEIQGRSS